MSFKQLTLEGILCDVEDAQVDDAVASAVASAPSKQTFGLGEAASASKL